MTVILDPGTDPDSYTDHVSRPWKATAGLWHGKDTTDLANYNNEVTLYNNEVTAFNNLQSGLNSPDGGVSVACNWTFANGSTSNQDWGTFTLTLPRAGHFVVGFYADGSHANAGFGHDFTFVLAGTAGLSKSQKTDSINNNGTTNFHGGYIGHGDFTSGLTITVQLLASFVSATGGTATGIIYAHFVPDATHHN